MKHIEEYIYILIQDGVQVAKVFASSDLEAKREIDHYALIYSADGPVEIRRVL